LRRMPSLPVPLVDSLRLSQDLDPFGTSGNSLPACAGCFVPERPAMTYPTFIGPFIPGQAYDELSASSGPCIAG
jgi:hypothetical protein